MFWDKDMWLGNSPDLNPIENLWSVLKQALDNEPNQPSTIHGSGETTNPDLEEDQQKKTLKT